MNMHLPRAGYAIGHVVLLALLLSLAVFWPSSAFAQHTSLLCPAQSGTVTAGGTVTVNISACEVPGIGGLGPVDGGAFGPAFFPSHGTASTRRGGSGQWLLDYTHNGTTGIGSTDVFELADGSINGCCDIRFTITINAASVTADIGVTKTAAPVTGTTVRPGAAIRYTLVLTNNGPGTVTGATFFDDLTNANIGFASWVVSAQSGAPTISTPLSGTGDFSMTATMPNASSITVTVDVVVSNTATGGPLVSTLTYTPPVGLLGDVVGNNTATTSHPIGTAAADGALCAAPGAQGSLVQAGIPGGGVVNTYFPGAADVAAGSRCLPIGTASGVALAGPLTGGLSAGDLLLVIQMQGAEYDSSNSDAYGDGVAGVPASGVLNNANRIAGRYEYVTVRSTGAVCASGQIGVSGGGPNRGLINAYDTQEFAAGVTSQRRYQIVRVPQYTTVNLGTGQLNALEWNGSVGGVLAVDVRDTLNLGTGSTVKFNATGAGFRGGRGQPTTGFVAGFGRTDFRNIAGIGGVAMHASKGEGFAGRPRFLPSADIGDEGYLNGSFARGAPANAGGGGTDCAESGLGPGYNAGGGGGGNGGAGGRGGDCWISGGLGPFDMGGFGGAAVTDLNRLFAGGGGGAGGINDSTANSANGGRGGGIVLISANRVEGAGAIAANGSNGGAPSVGSDASGGGGAGGHLRLCANSGSGSNLSAITAQLRGGTGGSNTGLTATHGPGGGGGGGRYFFCGPQLALASLTADVAGGAAGTTLGGVSYGAQTGANGSSLAQVAYTDTLGTKPGFICASGTVPVTLSDVEARVEGSELVVRFGTASEAGTLGYRVYADIPNRVDMQLGREVTLSRGDSLKPERYEVRGAYRGAREVWIQELAVNGKETTYGPFAVNTLVGERNIAVATDWIRIGEEQRSFRQAQQAQLAARSESEIEARVTRDGEYVIRAADLTALGMTWDGAPAASIQVLRGTTTVPATLSQSTWGANAELRFYGEAIAGSLYTETNVYRIVRSGTAQAQRRVYAQVGGLTTLSATTSEFSFAPNRAYSFSSPTGDPWFAQRLARSASTNIPGMETITLPDYLSGPDERLTIDLWGGLDYPEAAPDHAVEVSLNNTVLGVVRFDGIVGQSQSFDLPAGLLSSSNTLQLRLVDTGYSADVVYLEGVRIQYRRALRLDAEGRLQFTAAADAPPSATLPERIFASGFGDDGAAACAATTPGCVAYSVQVNGAGLRAYLLRGNEAMLLDGRIRVVDGAQRLEFAVATQRGDRFHVQAQPTTPSLSLAAPVGDLLSGTDVSYLIITHPSFAAGLGPLIDDRTASGFVVKTVNVEDLYRSYTAGVVDPHAISAYLREAKQRWASLTHVLLVGGDTYDYKNRLGLNSISFVPTQYLQTHPVVRYAPVDQTYADLNGDRQPDLALGRFPVRSLSELDAVIAKTLAYPTAGNAGKQVWANDRDSNSYPFADKASGFANVLTGFAVTRVDLNQFAPGAQAQARGALVSALVDGQALLGYYGHSSPSSWSREGLLTTAVVQGGVFASTRPTTVVQFGCWGGYFVEPTNTSLSAALLAAPQGAAAVLGATGLTEAVNDELQAAKLLPLLSQGMTLGEALKQSSGAVIQADPAAVDVSVGAILLGDPALRVNRQP